MTKLIHVGVPCREGRPHAAMVDALLGEIYLAKERHDVVLFVDWCLYCSNVGNARNRLVQRFQKAKLSDTLVMVDDDMSWKSGELTRLALSPYEVIGGTYRPRNGEKRFLALPPFRPLGGDLYDVAGLPGGFLKMSASVFERIVPEQYKEQNGVTYTNYFANGVFNGTYLSEDYGFCWHVRAAGGHCVLDASFILKHHEGQHHFTGDPKPWIEENC